MRQPAGDSKLTAFVCGFWRGLGAAGLARAPLELPPEAIVTKQQLPARPPRAESDWERVGAALRKARTP